MALGTINSKNSGDKAPPTSTEGRHLPRLLARVEDLSGPQPSFHASIVFFSLPMQSAEGCHALCKDPPPHKSKESRPLPRLLASLENLSGPQPCFQASIVFS